MKSENINILVLDDEASIRWVIEKTLSHTGHNLHFANSAEAAARLLDDTPIDFALVDVNLPGDDGLTFLERQRREHPDLLMAVITGQGSMDTAVTAMRLGAFDYLTKPFDIDELEAMVEKAAQTVVSARTHKKTDMPSTGGKTVDLIIGKSRGVREIFKAVGRVAATDISVLILGESGTGKELIARAVHEHSPRSEEPFMAVNCAAIPRELLESELFGYEKGAFTGATERKIGKLEGAKGGTIFLDEIGDMPSELQAKLLRVLQEKEFQRVGALNMLPLKARVVAATNQELLGEGVGFREDLYYRLSGMVIESPPLRERKEDISLLVDHFLRDSSEKMGLSARIVTPEALDFLTAYNWPGNIRELENVVKSLTIMTRSKVIHTDDLPKNLFGPKGSGSQSGEDFEQALARFWSPTIREHCAENKPGLLAKVRDPVEKYLIKTVLSQTGQNQVRTAQILGLNRNTLRTRMQALSIRKPLKP